MRSKRSMTIGLIVTDIRNPYFAELAMAVEVVLAQRGFALLQGYSLDERGREDRLLGGDVRAARRRRVPAAGEGHDGGRPARSPRGRRHSARA